MKKVTVKKMLRMAYASLSMTAAAGGYWDEKTMPAGEATAHGKAIDDAIAGFLNAAGFAHDSAGESAAAHMHLIARMWRPGDENPDGAVFEAFDALLAHCDPAKLVQEIDV